MFLKLIEIFLCSKLPVFHAIVCFLCPDIEYQTYGK